MFPGRPLRAVLAHPALRRIGEVSYGMYIFHPLCLMFIATALSMVGIDLGTFTRWRVANAVLQFAPCSACTYAVAEVSYRYFERPILGLKDRFRSPEPITS